MRLPGDLDARALLATAREQGVAFQPGPNFSAEGGCRQYARLSFTYYDEPRLQEAIARLAKIVPGAG